MTIVDDPKINYGKINSNESSTALKGLIAGGVLAAAVAFLIEFLNKKVKPDDDLYELYGIPVFAEILSFDLSLKNNTRYNKYMNSAQTADNVAESKEGKKKSKKGAK